MADANCDRIERLIGDQLPNLAANAGGWDVLYVEPSDGRHWELIDPQSHLHGGGPPMLKQLTKEDARSKYGIAVTD